MTIFSKKIQAINKYFILKTKKNIRLFLRLANFSKQFIIKFFSLIKLLTKLTKDINKFV